MRRKRAALFTLFFLVSLVAVPVMLTWWVVRHERLNQALIAAVDRNDTAGVRSLLRPGADPNAQVVSDDNRPAWKRLWDLLRHVPVPASVSTETVLEKAIEWYPRDASANNDRDNSDTICALLDAGADANLRITGVHFTTVPAIPSDVHRLRTVPLVEAAYHGQWETVRGLLDHHADVNATDEYGDTALMYAVNQWDTDMVETLIKRGASVRAKGLLGETALFWAFDNGMGPRMHIRVTSLRDGVTISNPTLHAIVRCLLRSGASVNDTDSGGDTVMSLARKWGDRQLIQMLQRAGAKD